LEPAPGFAQIASEVLAIQSASYELQTAEIQFFLAFEEKLSALLRSIESYPTLQTAWGIYASENGEQLDAGSPSLVLRRF
jgi:hypothetical protein